MVSFICVTFAIGFGWIKRLSIEFSATAEMLVIA